MCCYTCFKYIKTNNTHRFQNICKICRFDFPYNISSYHPKETIIKISTELYGMIFHNDFLISDLEKIKYQESLQEKIIAGLAAQCFLKIKN
jgi:hypothetical protein